MKDPGRAARLKALRVAVAAPASGVVCVAVFARPDAVLYAVFASLYALTFADFGGRMRDRVAAYLAVGVGGSVAVALGHLVAVNAYLAAATGVLVGSLIAFVTLLRGYIGAGAATVQLGFIVAATAGPNVALTDQLLGWGIGSLIATASAGLLWPVRGISGLRIATAHALDAGADAVHARWVRAESGDELERFLDSYRQVRRSYRGSLSRPGVSRTRERALVELIAELHRLRGLLAWRDDDRGSTGIDQELAAVIETTLRQSAACLVADGPAPDPRRLAAARDRHFAASAREVAADLERGDVPGALGDVETSFPLRLSAISGQFLAEHTRGAMGLPRTPVRTAEGMVLPGSTWETSPVRMLRAHSTLRSPWLRNGLRSGLGLGLAILVALLLGQESAFWVVLGTLSVLRFDAQGTGRTAVQALLGTLAGCLVGAAVAEVLGAGSPALWVAVPVTVFLAAYTVGPRTVALGQGAFSLFLIVLYALTTSDSPWSTGLVRLTDIALGAAVSVVVGMLLWPRGVLPQVRSALAEALRGSGDYALATTEALAARLAGTQQPDWPHASHTAIRRHALQAAGRAEETVDLAVTAQNALASQTLRWATLAGVGHHFIEAADVMAALGRPPPRGPGAATVGEHMLALAHRTNTELGAVRVDLQHTPEESADAAEDMQGFGADPDPGSTDLGNPDAPAAGLEPDAEIDQLRAALTGSLVRWPTDPRTSMDAVRLIWAAQWQAYLAWSTGVAERAA